ncbi:MAG: TonB-dependent receptor plug domain-containing protein [Gammaproteobacteria bacterium]
MKFDLISKAVRYALVAGAVSALAAPVVFAQDAAQSTANQNQNANTAQLGKIEVTGTRIKRTSVETAQPITIITAQQIKQSGFTRIGDVLQSLTSVGGSTNLLVNNGNDGTADINLRNLGSQRLLVLIDGHRISTDISNIVDLNTIPTSIIDHIEILQDGASAIYGSDAISGVINIITIKNFNGAEANAYMGMYDGHSRGGGWDGKDQAYNFTIGTSNDHSGLVLNVSYTNQQPVSSGNRTISNVALFGVGGGSSATPAGRFLLLGGSACNKAIAAGSSITPTPTSGLCDLTTIAPGTYGNKAPGLNQFTNFTGADTYNYAPSNYLLTPLETTSFYTQGHYDLADNLTFTSQVLFNNRSSSQASAPEPLFLGYIDNGFTNAGVNVGVGAGNPYNPFGVDLVPYFPSQPQFATWCAAYGSPTCDTTGSTLYGLFRRTLEAGDRITTQDYDDYHISMGLNGYFDTLGSEWDWDMHSSYGRENHEEITYGGFNYANLQNSLSSNCPTQAGCVPLNLFGGATTGGLSSITPAQLAYLSFIEHTTILGNTRNYNADISNDQLFNLPAGPVGVAMGYEYLETDGQFQPDALVSAGISTDNPSQPTSGREATNAQYVEFNIPLVSNAPFMKDVSLDVANRWSQFKWGGVGTGNVYVPGADHTSTARAALRWQATDDLLLRGSWSQGFRLPSVSEFFSGADEGFPTVSDPCSSIAPGGPPRNPDAKYCVSNGHLLGKQQLNGQIGTISGGNANLTPERSISKTVGFVYNPGWMPGWDISVDYYHINLVNTVGSIGPQNIVNGCYINNVQSYCKLIQVLGGGVINAINNTNQNIGSTMTDGYDISTHYKFPSTSIGDFDLGLNMTFLKDFNATVPNSGSPSGFATSKLAGWGSSFPKRRANLKLGWHYGDWSAMLSEYFIDHMIEPCANSEVSNITAVCTYNGVNGPLKTYGPQGVSQNVADNHIGSVTYSDIEGTYHMDSWNTDFTLGIQNFLDRNPPSSVSAFLNSFNPAYNRVPGRYFYANVGVKF